jgi:hypothetical protein
MTTLKEARDKGKLGQFIKERDKHPHGDADALHRTVSSMALKKHRPADKQK